jgi:hypothetical protein
MGTLRLLAACLTVIALIAIFAPWDPVEGGGWGVRVALAVFVGGALAAGWIHRARPLAIGAAFGFLALAVFDTGCWLAYNLETSSVEWDDFGDQNHPASLLLFEILLFGVPAAIAGGALAFVGSLAHRRVPA